MMRKKNCLPLVLAVVLLCAVAISCERDPYYGSGTYLYSNGDFIEPPITPDEAAQEILSSMVYVEGGTFDMGATSEQGGYADVDESPVHQVTVSSFYMGETEVTQRQWKAIMGSNPSYFTGDNRPVECVSWNDCQAFIQKLNQLTGRTFRLPTEAEWEYAARGGKYHSGYKYSGSNEVGYVAWYGGNSGSQTHDVKTKQPNALGLYDMSGNVWEWCSDWYGSYSSGALTDPQGPSSGLNRVLRGGGWDGSTGYCRVSDRDFNGPDARRDDYGFRLSIVEGNDTGTLPTVTTAPVNNITSAAATLNGSVTNQGGSWVELRGFCWSTSSDPTLDNCLGQSSVGNGTGDFSYNISGLSLGTTYYVRAWATNSSGTAYGQTRSFQTVNDEVAQVIQEILNSMVYVEGGTFQMGATSEQGSDAESYESPVHQVTVSSFYMGETEVTQRQWKAIMGSNPSYFTGDNRPVENVSWNDCQAFIQKLNQLTGRTFRLPTEAEWEYAARGGVHHSGYKYAGSNVVGYVAWYEGNSGSQTHDVKTKQPNALGLYDMSGNVWEWCSDWYGNYSSGAQTNPQGPSSGSYRVLRGGSWGFHAGYCRVSSRYNFTPDSRIIHFGFRLSIVQ